MMSTLSLEAVMNLERMLGEQRIAKAKREMKNWEENANAILKEMEDRRLAPQNPQTYTDLGMDI
jgi:hypothetical protein